MKGRCINKRDSETRNEYKSFLGDHDRLFHMSVGLVLENVDSFMKD